MTPPSNSVPLSSSILPDRRIEPAKLGLLLFISMEIMIFAGLISAFMAFRMSPLQWPPLDQPRLPLGMTTVNSLVLLLSGFLLYRASKSLGMGRYDGFLREVDWAAGLGFLFLAVQGTEWFRMIRFGLTPSSGAFGGFFYLLIGLHGLHALGGLLALLWMRGRARRGNYEGGKTLEVDLCGTYWYFVVGLWPVLFVLVYL